MRLTNLLQKVLAEVAEYSDEEQDAIAALILEVIEDERQWELEFAASAGKLAKLARKLRQDIKEGRAKELEIDEL